MSDNGNGSVSFDLGELGPLKKGTSFTVSQLEAATGEQQGTTAYALAVLGIRDQMMRQMEKNGNPATVATVGGQLRILTDEEAAYYNEKVFNAGQRRARRAFKRQTQVDIRNLNPEQIQTHHRALEVHGRILLAIRRERCQRIQLSSTQRKTPGLPKPNGDDA